MKIENKDERHYYCHNCGTYKPISALVFNFNAFWCPKCLKKYRAANNYYKHPVGYYTCRNSKTGHIYNVPDSNCSGRCYDERITYQKEFDMPSSEWLEEYA
jgi:hypothetical protein